MTEDCIELTDADIIVILDETEQTNPGRTYQSDPEYGSDPQWEDSAGSYESSWNEGEDTEPLKEVR